MATVAAPWHTAGGTVYHIRTECREDLHLDRRLEGTASRQLCLDCAYGLIIEQEPQRIETLTTWLVDYRI